METLQRSLAQTSGNADVRGFLALLLQRAGRHGEAIGHFKEALNIAPESGNWWVGLGISCQEEKRLEEAESAFKRAILIEGLSPELHSFAGQQIKAIQRQPRKWLRFSQEGVGGKTGVRPGCHWIRNSLLLQPRR